MKTSPFSLRDTIQYVLPILVGVALFVPYAKITEGLEAVFLLSVLFSFSLHTPLSTLTRKVFSWLPLSRRPIAALETEHRWRSRSWDYDVLFYQRLDDKQREYLYLTASYADFHRITSFIFLSYAAVQLGTLLKTLPNGLAKVCAVRTPMAGGWEMPTLAAAVVAGLLAVTAFRDYLSEASDVITTYSHFAEKSHRMDDGLARGVWGWVTRQGKPAAGAVVTLLGGDQTLATAQADDSGRFFVSRPPSGTAVGTLVASLGDATASVRMDERRVPEYTLELS